MDFGLPSGNMFHNFPIFWLLPDAWAGVDPETGFAIPAADFVPDYVYDRINALPTDTRRIFLSHQSPEFFEFTPTPKTTILYMMREPHSVWYSMLKFNRRLVGQVNGAFPDPRTRKQMMELRKTTVVVGASAYNFVKGDVQVPPRLREHGPKFAWNLHLEAWEKKLVELRTIHGQPAHFIDFNNATVRGPRAIRQIGRAIGHPGWEAGNALGDRLAGLLAWDSKYEREQLRMVSFQGGRLDPAGIAHFGGTSTAHGSAWVDDFLDVPPAWQRLFNESTKVYQRIADDAGHRETGFMLA